ncbi:MAG: hypothetical protein ACJ0OQ_02730, partial [Candidatus Marisimplicoccus sp.]
MKLKTIFWITAILTLLQVVPLFGALFSEGIKEALIQDAFGVSTLSPDGMLMFETFALVLGCVIVGVFFLIIGATSIKDLHALRRISFLLFVVMGFLALPDLINAINGDPTAPLAVIMLNM